jgi:ribose transport system permease protein
LQPLSATPPEHAGRRRSVAERWLARHGPAVIALLLLIAMVVLYVTLYAVSVSALPGSFELTSTIDNAMPLVLAAVGQTIVVVTGGIDLSVGGTMDLTNSLAAAHMGGDPASMLLWSLAVLGVGALGGLLNGLLVTLGRLQPILVTLATLSIFQGIAIRVLPQPGGRVPHGLTNLVANPEEPTALAFLALVVLVWLGLRRTRLGVGLFAIGNDPRAARALGVRVAAVRVMAYVLSGLFAGAAGLFLAAAATSGDATSGDVFTLTSIAATVLGGVSFFGGRGSALGSVAGALALSVLVNVLFFAHINPLFQSFYQGLFLVVAVIAGGLVASLLRRRRLAR